MPKSLSGQRILVVGGSVGIGAALVRAAGQAGATVAAAARRIEALDALVAEVPGAVAIPLDVRDGDSVDAGVALARERLGGLDAVVYAAAISPLLPLSDATAADWHDVLATNVVGCALVARAAAPDLIASGGRLVVLSSKAVRQPFADLGLYSTSKVALDGLIRCLPIELPGLRVTRVMVGNTHSTDFASSWDAARLDASLTRWIEQGVLGSGHTMAPSEVAEAVLSVLVSPVHIEDIAVLEDPVPPVPLAAAEAERGAE